MLSAMRLEDFICRLHAFDHRPAFPCSGDMPYTDMYRSTGRRVYVARAVAVDARDMIQTLGSLS